MPWCSIPSAAVEAAGDAQKPPKVHHVACTLRHRQQSPEQPQKGSWVEKQPEDQAAATCAGEPVSQTTAVQMGIRVSWVPCSSRNRARPERPFCRDGTRTALRHRSEKRRQSQNLRKRRGGLSVVKPEAIGPGKAAIQCSCSALAGLPGDTEALGTGARSHPVLGISRQTFHSTYSLFGECCSFVNCESPGTCWMF